MEVSPVLPGLPLDVGALLVSRFWVGLIGSRSTLGAPRFEISLGLLGVSKIPCVGLCRYKIKGISMFYKTKCSDGEIKLALESVLSSSLSLKLIISLRSYILAVKQISWESSSSSETTSSTLKSRWKRISKSGVSTFSTNLDPVRTF